MHRCAGRCGWHIRGRYQEGGSSRIIFQEDEAKAVSQRHPDGQFQPRRAAYPGVVLEVSYPQDSKDLKKLAWQYTQLSNGDIKAVIGIDVNNAPNPSTVSLWRPNYVSEAGEDVLDVKQEVNSQELRLAPSDFATDELCDGLEATELSITYARLAGLFVQAQEMQTARDHATDGGVRSSRKNEWRAPSSSPDRLLSEDETRFRFDEERTAEEATAADDDFQLPPKKRSQLLAARHRTKIDLPEVEWYSAGNGMLSTDWVLETSTLLMRSLRVNHFDVAPDNIGNQLISPSCNAQSVSGTAVVQPDHFHLRDLTLDENHLFLSLTTPNATSPRPPDGMTAIKTALSPMSAPPASR
ncbi:hypothetical protein PG993_010818 [Apiospora rasikravindrae]|uniref:Uncharacterized protein n=1 Tax=Apiospora rasikravindrae TaxID=990691 RepID=A0ABR1SCF2_9PEZI